MRRGLRPRRQQPRQAVSQQQQRGSQPHKRTSVVPARPCPTEAPSGPQPRAHPQALARSGMPEPGRSTRAQPLGRPACRGITCIDQTQRTGESRALGGLQQPPASTAALLLGLGLLQDPLVSPQGLLVRRPSHPSPDENDAGNQPQPQGAKARKPAKPSSGAGSSPAAQPKAGSLRGSAAEQPCPASPSAMQPLDPRLRFRHCSSPRLSSVAAGQGCQASAQRGGSASRVARTCAAQVRDAAAVHWHTCGGTSSGPSGVQEGCQASLSQCADPAATGCSGCQAAC